MNTPWSYPYSYPSFLSSTRFPLPSSLFPHPAPDATPDWSSPLCLSC
jgi:hypothetical protein